MMISGRFVTMAPTGIRSKSLAIQIDACYGKMLVEYEWHRAFPAPTFTIIAATAGSKPDQGGFKWNRSGIPC